MSTIAPRNRCDRYTGKGYVKVTGRRDCTFETEQWFEQDLEYVVAPNEDLNYADFLLNDERQVITDNVRQGHFDFVEQKTDETALDLEVELREFAANRSIKSLQFAASGIQNSYECNPAIQADLVHYLSDPVTITNIYIGGGGTGKFAPQSEDFLDPDHGISEVYRYDPLIDGRFVLSTVEDGAANQAQVANAAYGTDGVYSDPYTFQNRWYLPQTESYTDVVAHPQRLDGTRFRLAQNKPAENDIVVSAPYDTELSWLDATNRAQAEAFHQTALNQNTIYIQHRGNELNQNDNTTWAQNTLTAATLRNLAVQNRNRRFALNGLQFKRVDNEVENAGAYQYFRPTWKCELTEYNFQIDRNAFATPLAGIAATIQGNPVFAFQAESSLSIQFDRNGFAKTVNTSTNALADIGDDYHVLKIFERAQNAAFNRGDLVASHGLNVGQIRAAQFDEDSGFHNALQYTVPDAAAYGIVTRFPNDHGQADRIDGLYIYLPIRRFARKAQKCGTVTAPLKPFLPRLVPGVQTQMEALYYATRAIQEGRSTAPLTSFFGSTTYPQSVVHPIFTTAEANLAQGDQGDFVRDKVYRLDGYAFLGVQIHIHLHAIAIDADIHADARFSYPVQFPGSALPDGTPVYPARMEIITFRKRDLTLVAANAGTQILGHGAYPGAYYFVGANASKYPAQANRLIAGTYDIALAAHNGANAGDVPGTPLFQEIYSLDRFMHQIANAQYTPITQGTRPSVAAAPGALATMAAGLNFGWTVADPLGNITVPVTAYYKKFLTAGGAQGYHADTPAGATGIALNPFIQDALDLVQLDDASPVFVDGAAAPPGIGANVATAPLRDPDFEAPATLLAAIEAHRGTVLAVDLPYSFTNPAPTPRSAFSVKVREPLLGFRGMAQFRPFRVYPQDSRFPPFLQDFRYTFSQGANSSEIGEVTANGVPVGVFATKTEPTRTLFLQSAPTFVQADKEIERLRMPVPQLRVFEKSFAYQGTMRVIGQQPPLSCDVDVAPRDGVPEYIFLQILQKSVQPDAFTVATIDQLDFQYLGQSFKTIRDYSSSALRQLTRRNSHPRALSSENETKIGATLLSRRDYADLVFWAGDHNLDFKIVCDAYSLGEGMPDADLTFRATFIYQNFALEGVNPSARFWRL